MSAQHSHSLSAESLDRACRMTRQPQVFGHSVGLGDQVLVSGWVLMIDGLCSSGPFGWIIWAAGLSLILSARPRLLG